MAVVGREILRFARGECGLRFVENGGVGVFVPAAGEEEVGGLVYGQASQGGAGAEEDGRFVSSLSSRISI